MTNSLIQEVVSNLNREGFECKFISENEGIHRYEAITGLSSTGQRTFLNFEVTGDVLRMAMTHMLGSVVNPEAIGAISSVNFGSFGTTGSFLTTKFVERFTIVCLESYQRYYEKWSPQQIAEMIFLTHTDIMMGLIVSQLPEGIEAFT